jgi:DNA-binding MarR family transcriptional regulator
LTRSAVDANADLLAIYDFTVLVTASARSARQHERIVRAVGAPISGSGLLTLRVVERYGPIAGSELARRLQVDQSTASRHVRPLEDLGLVTRTADGTDRRVAWLQVTGDGQRLLDRARDVALHDFDAALADWTPSDRRTLGALLDRLRASLLAAEVDESGWSVRRPSVPAPGS